MVFKTTHKIEGQTKQGPECTVRLSKPLQQQ